MNTITPATLEKNVESAVETLLKTARDLTWNKISPNCKFILSEIRDMNGNFHDQTLTIQKENNRKKPVSFGDIMPVILQRYSLLYEIDLHIYKAKKHETVIDIRYVNKHSFDDAYYKQVANDPPMLHCKVSMPPWLPMDKPKPKFDINWEHKHLYFKWQMYLLRRKLRLYKQGKIKAPWRQH